MTEPIIERAPAPWGVTIYSDVGILTFDATLSENHVHSVELTKHPVEEGADISDHARQRPAELTLLNVFTLTPTEEGFAERDRDRRLYEDLLRIARARQLVSVVTHLGQLDNMMIVEVATPVGPDDGNAIIPSVRLEEVFIVRGEKVGIPPEFLAESVRPDVAAREQTGEQTPREATEEEADAVDNRTFARRANDNIGDRGFLQGLLGL